MQMNVPRAAMGLGTTGIGDNFARQRMLMAQKAGYVQSAPSPYSQPGTALKSYQSAAPMLQQIANAQRTHGIPGLLRQGMMAPKPMPGSQPMVNFNSQMAGHAGGNPFQFQMGGAPQMPAQGAPQANPMQLIQLLLGGRH